MRPRPSAVPFFLALAFAGCREGHGPMRPDPPPAGWEARLAAERAEKDREFRDAPDSPIPVDERAAFRGLTHWPPDPALRFSGAIEVDERLVRFEIPSTTGAMRPCERYGRVRFAIGGRELVLHVYRLLDLDNRPGESTYFLPFTDETTGVETYPAGRYVDLEGPKDGPFVLDFNRAYNPSCAYGDPQRFACPVTPKENHLPVRIEAGERGFHPTASAAS
jgi:uncharacterized protein (DUF1684 family)